MDFLHDNTGLQGSLEVAPGTSHLPTPCLLLTSCFPMVQWQTCLWGLQLEESM